MRRILFIALATILFSLQHGFSQDIPEGAIMINENTVIKDVDGNRVDMMKFMSMMNSGEWSMDPVKDEEGNLLHMQLRKATEEEKKMMAEMMLQGGGSDMIGKAAPDFSMTDRDGNEISKANMEGKVLVLNFWFAACKPCIDEIPELNEVYEKYKDNPNVVFAAVTFEKDTRVEAFLKKHPLTYPIVSNARATVNEFDVNAFPTNIVIDKKGNYYEYTTGGFPHIGDHISNAIQGAIDGKTPMMGGMPEGGEMIDPNSTFKLENDETVSFDKVVEMLQSGNYDMIPKDDFYLLKEKK